MQINGQPSANTIPEILQQLQTLPSTFQDYAATLNDPDKVSAYNNAKALYDEGFYKLHQHNNIDNRWHYNTAITPDEYSAAIKKYKDSIDQFLRAENYEWVEYVNNELVFIFQKHDPMELMLYELDAEQKLESSIAAKDQQAELKARFALGAAYRAGDHFKESSKHYAKAYLLQQGSVDNEAVRVEQHEVAFSDQEKIGTDNVQQCVVVIVRDPESKRTMLAHVDIHTDASYLTESIIKEFSTTNTLEARITGGRDRSTTMQKTVNGQTETVLVSDVNIKNVVEQLQKLNINVKSADIADKPSPSGIIFDPITGILEYKIPGKIDKTQGLRIANFISNTKNPEALHFVFDLTKAKNIKPPKLTITQQKYVINKFITHIKNFKSRIDDVSSLPTLSSWQANLQLVPFEEAAEAIRQNNLDLVYTVLLEQLKPAINPFNDVQQQFFKFYFLNKLVDKNIPISTLVWKLESGQLQGELKQEYIITLLLDYESKAVETAKKAELIKQQNPDLVAKILTERVNNKISKLELSPAAKVILEQTLNNKIKIKLISSSITAVYKEVNEQLTKVTTKSNIDRLTELGITEAEYLDIDNNNHDLAQFMWWDSEDIREFLDKSHLTIQEIVLHGPDRAFIIISNKNSILDLIEQGALSAHGVLSEDESSLKALIAINNFSAASCSIGNRKKRSTCINDDDFNNQIEDYFAELEPLDFTHLNEVGLTLKKLQDLYEVNPELVKSLIKSKGHLDKLSPLRISDKETLKVLKKDPAIVTSLIKLGLNVDINEATIGHLTKPSVQEHKGNWGSKVESAGLLPLLAQFSSDFAQEDYTKLAKDIAMVAAPTLADKATAKMLLPVLKEEVYPKILENLETIAEKYASTEAVAQASKIATNILEVHPPLKAIPGIFGRLTNIALMVSQGTEGQVGISIVVNDSIIGIESLQIFSELMVGEEIPGLNVIITALMVEEWARGGIKGVQEINKKLQLTTWEDVQNFFSVLFTGSPTDQTENNLIAREIYQKWLQTIKQQFLDNRTYEIIVEPIPDILTTKQTTAEKVQKAKHIRRCKTKETTTSKLLKREEPASAKISSYNTSDSDVSRLFQASPKASPGQPNTIGAPNNDEVNEEDNYGNDDYQIPYSGMVNCNPGLVVKKSTKKLTTNNKPNNKPNQYDGFVAVAKSVPVSDAPEVLVFAGKAGDKINISAPGKYTTVVMPGSESLDITLPEDSHAAMILPNGRNLTAEESSQTVAKVIVSNGCNDINLAKKTTISASCGTIDLSPNKSNIVHILKENKATLEINHIDNEDVISFDHKVQDLTKIRYDKISKKLTLDFGNHQKVVIITAFDKDNNPLLHFRDFNVQLGKYDDATGVIDKLHITLGTDEGTPTEIAAKALNLTNNKTFSGKFQYAITLQNEKVFVFATNNDNTQLVYFVAGKENHAIFSSNKQTLPIKVVMAKETDAFIYSDSKVEVDFSSMSSRDQGNLNYRASEVYYGPDENYKVNIQPLFNSKLSEGSRIIKNAYESYIVNEAGGLEPSDAINLSAKQHITIPAETLASMNHQISFTQDISKEYVEFAIDGKDIIVFFPQISSIIRFGGAGEIITNFRSKLNKDSGFWHALFHPIETLQEVEAATVLQLSMVDGSAISFSFVDGEVTENDLLTARTLHSVFVETVGAGKSVELNKGATISIYPINGNLHLNYDGKCLKEITAFPSENKNEYTVNIAKDAAIEIHEADSIPVAPILSCKDFAGTLPTNSTQASVQMNLKVVRYKLDNLSSGGKALLQDISYLFQALNMNNPACRKYLGGAPTNFSSDFPTTLNNDNVDKALLLFMVELYYKWSLVSGSKEMLISNLVDCIPIPNSTWSKLSRKLEKNDGKPLSHKVSKIYPELKADLLKAITSARETGGFAPAVDAGLDDEFNVYQSDQAVASDSQEDTILFDDFFEKVQGSEVLNPNLIESSDENGESAYNKPAYERLSGWFSKAASSASGFPPTAAADDAYTAGRYKALWEASASEENKIPYLPRAEQAEASNTKHSESKIFSDKQVEPENANSAVAMFEPHKIVTGVVCGKVVRNADGSTDQRCTYKAVAVKESKSEGCYQDPATKGISCSTLNIFSTECTISANPDNEKSGICDPNLGYDNTPKPMKFRNESELKSFLGNQDNSVSLFSTIHNNTSFVLQLHNIYDTTENALGGFQDKPVAKFVTVIGASSLAIGVASLIPSPIESIGPIALIPSASSYSKLIKEYLPMEDGVCKSVISFVGAGAVIAATSYNPYMQLGVTLYTIGNKVKGYLSKDSNASTAKAVVITAATTAAATQSDVAEVVKSIPTIKDGIGNLQIISSIWSVGEFIHDNLPDSSSFELPILGCYFHLGHP